MAKQLFLGFILLITFAQDSKAQVERNSRLYTTILLKDSLLFNAGFNTCDISQFENLLADQFEFFHDKDSISNKQKFLNDLRNGLCKSPTTYRSRRELVSGSTRVFPLYKKNVLYGAVQTGDHRFYETISGNKETYAGSAKFTHVWLLQKGVWKLAKGLSFDHQDTDSARYQAAGFDNDAAIEKWMKEIHLPTLGIGVIKDGKLQQVKVFGSLQNGISAPYNTIFNVASLTKPVTAMVALQFVSSGKWNLDAPVYKYWTDPDVAQDEKHKILTTRHILTHQTGFPNWRWNNEDGKLHFEFTPGTKYQYSGEGYEYLRKALENKFHKSLDQLAAEMIFKPLKMADTKYIWTERTDSTRFARGYNNQGKPYKTVKHKTANAADDLLTTIADYGNFLVSVLNGDGLSEKVFTAMMSKQVAIKKDKYFGLGFEIYDLGNGTIALSHGGADKGCQTIVFLLPETKQGLIIFTNADEGYKAYEKILTHYLGEYGRKIIAIEMHAE